MTRGNETGARGENGDGWVTGAWSTEGWMSATAPRGPAPPPGDAEPPVEFDDEAVTGELPVITPRRPTTQDVAHPEPGPATGTPLSAPPAAMVSAGPPAAPTSPDPLLAPSSPSPPPDAATGAQTPPDGLPGPSGHGPTGRGSRGRGPSGPAGPIEIAARFATVGPAAGKPAWIDPGDVGPPRRPLVTVRPAAPPVVRARPETPSAAELSEDAILRNRGDRPRQGWRGALFKATGGKINPGIGPEERARQEQLRRIRRPLPGSHQIAVSSIKGGVGKTSVAACLGLVLAENRGDRVVALDANPDAGTLADRLTAETAVTVRDLIANLGYVHSLTDVARYTTLAGRLQVLASEQDPAMSEAFNRSEYERVCAVLARFYNIIITDSGTGLVHSAMEGTLALADSLVVVGAPTVDGASRASKTLDWLIAHGHARAVSEAVVVLSCDRTSKEVDRGLVRKHFEARCRAVVEVPHDPHLSTGGRVELLRLRRPTLDAFLELAALLADGFGTPQSAVARKAPSLR